MHAYESDVETVSDAILYVRRRSAKVAAIFAGDDVVSPAHTPRGMSEVFAHALDRFAVYDFDGELGGFGGMGAAPLLRVKPLSLLLISIAAIACASNGGTPATPPYVSAYAPHPLNVEPPRHTTTPEHSAQAGAPPSAPRPPSAEPPPRAAPRADAAPTPAWTAWLDPGAPDAIPVREAVAVLVPTEGNHVTGVVRFRDDGSGSMLEVIASVDGLAGSAHAYHVHAYGDCSSPDAESAGPHFHFTGSSFDKRPRIITGDLGELRPDDRLTTTDHARIEATLQGRFSIIGRSVVVHARGNDPASPPEGAAGKRLACGVIGVAGPAPAPATARTP